MIDSGYVIRETIVPPIASHRRAKLGAITCGATEVREQHTDPSTGQELIIKIENISHSPIRPTVNKEHRRVRGLTNGGFHVPALLGKAIWTSELKMLIG